MAKNKPGMKVPSSIMKKIENSKEDRNRDRKQVYAEGSRKDMLSDMAQAKRMMKKGNKK